MRVHITLLRHEVDLYLGQARPEDDEPTHVEDHTGYTVGFVPPPPASDLVDLPQRDL